MKIEPEFHIAVLAKRDGLDLDNYPPTNPCVCGSHKAFGNCCMTESPKFLKGRFTRLGMAFMVACKQRHEYSKIRALADQYNDTLKALMVLEPATYGKMAILNIGGSE